MRAVRAHGAGTGPVSLWKIPGRKHLTHAGSQLSLTVEQGPNHLRASLDTDLEDCSPYGLTVPLDSHLRTRLSGYQVQANAIQGKWPSVDARRITRASLLHLRLAGA